MPNTPLHLVGAAAALALSAAVGPYSALVPAPDATPTPAARAAARAAAAAFVNSHVHGIGQRHIPHSVAHTMPVAGGAEVAPARVVVVTARDYAFEMPDTLTAGHTELQLVNQGAELHHAALVRLDAGKTAADLYAALKAGGPPPAWVHDAGGPNAPAPGARSAAVVDLAPGTYVMLCMVPSPDGTPHVMKGMSHALTVVPERQARLASHVHGANAAPAAPLVASAPDVTMTLTDYDFVLSRPLARGRHVVRVRNGASQPHEVFVARLAPGKTAAEALAWVEKPQGPPAFQPLGGTVGMAPGVANDIALDLAPGEYALYCFYPDAKDGKPHVAHGMMKQFTVR